MLLGSGNKNCCKKKKKKTVPVLLHLRILLKRQDKHTEAKGVCAKCPLSVTKALPRECVSLGWPGKIPEVPALDLKEEAGFR